MRRHAVVGVGLLAGACSFDGARVPGVSDGGIDAAIVDAAAAADAGPVRGDRVSCERLAPITTADHIVSTAAELAAAVTAAQANEVIGIMPGTYDVAERLLLNDNGVTLRSMSGDPDSVVIRGPFTPADPGHLFSLVVVEASNVTVAAVTLENASRTIRVQALAGAQLSGMRIFDVTARRWLQIGVDVVADANASTNNGGLVACSRVGEPLPEACDAFQIGIDLSDPVDDWRVTENTVGPACYPRLGTLHSAIRVSAGARRTIVDHNRIIDFDTGLQLGETPAQTPACVDDESPGWDQFGTVACANLLAFSNPSGAMPVQGINARHGCDVLIAYNTVAWNTALIAALRIFGDASTIAYANNALTGSVIETQGGAPSFAGPDVVGLTAADFVGYPDDLRLTVQAPGARDLSTEPRAEAYCSWDLQGNERLLAEPGFGAFAPQAGPPTANR